MELDPCSGEVVWQDVEFPIDFDPKPDTWYELWAHGQVFSPIGCEVDTSNNWFKTQFKIVDVHDMACVGMELINPEDGITSPGNPVTVNVTVKNLGSFTESGVPVDLLVGNMVVDEVMNTDFETDPSGLFNAYYFIGGTGDVPFRWTAGDAGISQIYTNDPAQARSKKPGNEALICAEEGGTLPYLIEDTACYLEIPGLIDLDKNDNGVQDYGDPAAAYLKFDAKWSMECEEDTYYGGYYAGTLGSLAELAVSFAEGPASGYVLFFDFGIGSDPDFYENDWQHLEFDLFDVIDDARNYWETNYGWVYEDIPEFNIGWVVFADGIGIDFLPGDPDGGVSNPFNPVPWTGFMLDRVQLGIIEAEDGSLEKVASGNTGSIAPGGEETLQLTWSDTELCHHALVADVNADDDINPNNDRCFESVKILDEEKCFDGGTTDLTDIGDCLWHVCTNRENGDDYFAWTGIVEEHWAHYVNNQDESIISPTINVTGFADEGVAVNFTTYYELASGDFGEVYVQYAGEWHKIGKFTGSSGGGFKAASLVIPESLCSDFFKLKFRFFSDDEYVSEGWFFDDVYIVDLTDDGFTGSLADTWYCHGAYPTEGPGEMGEAAPGSWTQLGPNTAADFISGACWAYDQWYCCQYSAGSSPVYITDIDGTMTLLGTSSASLSGLAYDEITDTMYACSGTALYEMDPSDGSTTLIGSFTGISGPLMIDMAILDGVCYGHDIVTDSIYTIDLGSAACTLLGPTGLSCNYAQGMASDKDNGKLYLAAYTASGEMYEVNIGNGATTYIGAFPGGNEMDGFAIPFAGGSGADVTYGDIIPALMWLDPEGDNAMPHGVVEDFERGVLDPWICAQEYGGNYWKYSENPSTLINEDEGYDFDECDDCINGWYVIEGYGDGPSINNAQWIELDLSDPNLIYAELDFVMDYSLSKETIYIEFSPDWEPGTDMDDATWTAYFVHTPGDNYGNDLGGWTNIDDLVGDDRFVIDEYLGNVVYLRFRLTTEGNGKAVGDGWAIDGLTLVVKRLEGPVTPDDTVPPGTDIFFNEQTGQITLVATDFPLNKASGVAATYYILDGGAQTEYMGPFTIGEGTHTVEYWSEDNAGNVEGTNTATFTVDTTEPTVELTSPEAGIYFLGNKLLNFGSKAICIGKVPIAADADDGTGSGIARVLFDVDGDTGYDATAPYEYTFRGMAFGSLTIKATAIDNKGLMSDPAEMTVTCFSLGLL
jgi:hypothetical protein